MSELLLDAEALYLELKRGVQRLLTADTALVGIWSGGAWLAERLAADLNVAGFRHHLQRDAPRRLRLARPGQGGPHQAALRRQRPRHSC